MNDPPSEHVWRLRNRRARTALLDAPALPLTEGLPFRRNPLSAAIAGPPEGDGAGSRRGGKDDVAGHAACPGLDGYGTVGDQLVMLGSIGGVSLPGASRFADPSWLPCPYVSPVMAIELWPKQVPAPGAVTGPIGTGRNAIHLIYRRATACSVACVVMFDACYWQTAASGSATRYKSP